MTVKYIMLLYANPDAPFPPEADREAAMAEAGRIMDELKASGEWVGGEPLADVSQTKVVQSRDGVPVVTDGPFLESKEHLIGFCMIDAETPERAVEIAASWPDARWHGVELRPVMTMSGDV
jgi:hypothetical protein